jgi:hypothetical protein
MKTKCEPGDKLTLPDGTEYYFLGYFDEDTALIMERASYNAPEGTPKIRVVCKCCTPKLHELITESPAPPPPDSQKTGPESP